MPFRASAEVAMTGGKVLVVDDEAAIRDSLAGCLTLEGYDVMTSPGGASALALLAERMPDIVILDVMMPLADGLEVCRRMRADGYDIPVLLLTARDLDEGIDIHALGADDYLPKPFALDELVARLRALLSYVADDPVGGRLQYADLVMDPVTREVSRDGVLLSYREERLLADPGDSGWHAASVQLLVVEDDPALADSLVRALEFEGYTVAVAADAESALAAVRTQVIDGIVLDVGLPGVSGLELTRRLRREGNPVPVLMLTARQLTGDRVAGLDAGADDYVTKPFELEELLARVRALLRRSVHSLADDGELVVSDLRLDPRSHEVWRGERELSLTHTEFELLELLMAHSRQVLSRTQILQIIWGVEDPRSNNLDVFIGSLRRKTEGWGHPRLIHTVRGAGYVIKEARES